MLVVRRRAAAFAALLAFGCEPERSPAPGVASALVPPGTRAEPPADAPAAPGESAAPGAAGAPAVIASARPGGTSSPCPPDMRAVPGGTFRVGSPATSGAPEESPSFVTRVAPLCLDRTEVTVAAYRACVAAGGCTAAGREGRFCNERLGGRDAHPANCVTWHQADAYCARVGRRLPTEIEWEFTARGGERYLEYPWGNAPPGGKTCWKHVGGTCATGEFPPGPFDLVDVGGNVWEWSADWFGPYPWEPSSGGTRSYRGGSWSRRFEKWMRPRLRNRGRPEDSGSHLGFRCALTPAGVECPYGPREGGQGCARGVETADCPAGQQWNGARCARPGEPRCAAGRVERRGRGCVLEHAAEGPSLETSKEPVARARAAAHDADCEQHQPSRPHAYHLTGGTHQGRNAAGASRGCRNRDVGVGWNSVCCP